MRVQVDAGDAVHAFGHGARWSSRARNHGSSEPSAAPKEMPTRFGTLKFFDGVPDQASTQKIFDNLDFQRAMQGYLSKPPFDLDGEPENYPKREEIHDRPRIR